MKMTSLAGNAKLALFCGVLSLASCVRLDPSPAGPSGPTNPADSPMGPPQRQTEDPEQLTFQRYWRSDTGPASPAEPVEVTAKEVALQDVRVTGPYTHDNLEVFLIHGKDRAQGTRNILTLQEALEQNKVRVHETSQVQELVIENLTADTDIYVQAGDIVQGGKQDRVISVDLMVSAGSGHLPLASFCVEQGRWSARGDVVSSVEGRGPPTTADNLQSEALVEARPGTAIPIGGSSWRPTLVFDSSRNSLSSSELKRAVKLENAQARVWEQVAATQDHLTHRLGGAEGVISTSFGSSLEMTLEGDKVKQACGEYSKALASILDEKKDVIGYAFAINGKLNCADLYMSANLFRKLWLKTLNACAVEAITKKPADTQKADDPATDKDAVLAFFEVDSQGEAMLRKVSSRVHVLTVDNEGMTFFETRDKDLGEAWLHRSYLAK